MNIYTSYFANWRNFPKEVTKYAVARELKWETDMEKLLLFCPSSEILHAYKCELLDEEGFTSQYMQQLNSISEEELSEIVTKLKESETDVVLLCYEKKGCFCHRNLLKDFLNEKFSLNIKEL